MSSFFYLFDKNIPLEDQLENLDIAEAYLDEIYERNLALNLVTDHMQNQHDFFKGILLYLRRIILPQLEADRCIIAMLSGKPVEDKKNICPVCGSWLQVHPDPDMALRGWLKCSCGYCCKDE